ncbi:proteasome subunit beta [Kibdelosporangium phytohabitans]|uniref:Proteasome subunit beta n=1 Tax=Kibdelosporangium phytohabitans TaxID=860235 RepID=A0A0N9HUR2_9PSEU|nr:proteasome subunit beta [Kibdelosporangium phytohabitans]ALG08961.1 proteasome subunit beta [Kibdelosporangium phytohabitans]MBE1469867.1 proteasome beta subunit [Kibdelosporangium phytohabitans]
MDHTFSRQGAGTGLPAAYLSAASLSFSDFLRSQAPDLLPGARAAELNNQAALSDVPHGTTIVAVTYQGGVLLAGDRRATSGNLIAQRDMEKVYVTDEYSAVGIAGTAGLAVEMVRLYTVELAYYEKIEGVPLSLDGKANKLATTVRENLTMAMNGLAVVPLFVGYDVDADSPRGRIVSYDVVGGRYEERAGFHAVGSGSLFARSALKKLYDPDGGQDAAIRWAVEALYDAAEDDTATGGPDIHRRIFPSIITITGADGAVRLPEEQTSAVAEAVVADRSQRPRG